jgi:catechol 2,3-dioxygenase-like lactoylglutathione lyase family enzyme
MDNEQTSSIKEMEHIGIMVPDLDKAIEYFSQALGIKKFRIFESTRKLGGSKDTPPSKQRVGFAKMGNTLIELMQTVEGTNRFQELANTTGEAVHLAFTVGNLEQELKRASAHGLRILASGKNNLADGGSSALLGAKEPGGLLIQLLQVNKPLMERVALEDKEITK